MKSCPSCGLKYADDSLQFCLSDGTQLLTVMRSESEEPATVLRPTAAGSTSGEKTVDETFFRSKFQSAEPRFVESLAPEQNADTIVNSSPSESHIASDQQKNTATNKLLSKILTLAPVSIALMQNYWQWLYMTQHNSFAFPGFLFSVNFWVWLFLLTGGAVLCVMAIQRNINRALAVVGAIILAVNLLLCLVPRRF